MFSPKVLSGTFILVLTVCEIFSIDFQFERIVMLNATYVEGRYNISMLRILRMNRTTYALSVDFKICRDLGEDYSLEVLFYNRFNNNQYYRTPASISKRNLCDAANRYYQEFVGDPLKNFSNFKQFKTGESACPFPKFSFAQILSNLNNI